MENKHTMNNKWKKLQENIKTETDQEPYAVTSLNEVTSVRQIKRSIPWSDISNEMLASPEFEAVWQTIKTWDICVPEVDGDGCYSGATGNHVKAILDALNTEKLVEHLQQDFVLFFNR